MNALRLLNKSSRQTFFFNEKLIFEFDEFYIEIVLEFDNRKEIKDDYYTVNLSFFKDRFEELLNEKYRIKEVILSASEYLGWRGEQESFSSICAKLYIYLIQLKVFDNDIILYYRLRLFYGDDYFYCNAEPSYIFEIQVNKNLIESITFIQFILNKLKDTSSKPPKFYWNFYRNYKRLEDIKETAIVNTNTKARRLGYLILLSDLFNVQNKVASNYINRKFEKFVIPSTDELIIYKNPKGLIKKTNSGISAKPYILVARELGLLNLLNNIYSTSKLFKVYIVLRGQFSIKNNNVFSLSSFDKLFFLEILLKKDFLYLSIILELSYIRKSTNYAELLKNFQQSLLHRLNEYKANLSEENNLKPIRKINTLIERINKWEKTEVYLEHVLMPRLNWLYDLELIELDDKLNVKLTNIGEKLFENLCFWNDINFERIISPNEFIDSFIVQLFDNCYNNKINTLPRAEEVSNSIHQYLIDSFQHFKTLAPNRVTASQAINFTKYKLYFTNNIAVDYNFIERYLTSSKQNTFIYKYQPRYNDGYIQIRKKT